MMNSRFKPIGLAATIAAVLTGSNSGQALPRIPRQPIGGHRRPGYKKTDADIARIEAARRRRMRRAAKRHNDYLRCLQSNPCLDH